MVTRAYRSGGSTDPTAAANLKNAAAKGISADIYIFPCVPCGNPASQVSKTVSYLEGVSAKFNMLWLDIENLRWSTDKRANVQFIEGMLNEATSLLGKSRVGIYTNKYMWSTIAGDSTVGKDYALWYAHYDDNPSFSDFSSFGGWTRPYAKQFKGDATVCGTDVDLNYKQ